MAASAAVPAGASGRAVCPEQPPTWRPGVAGPGRGGSLYSRPQPSGRRGQNHVVAVTGAGAASRLRLGGELGVRSPEWPGACRRVGHEGHQAQSAVAGAGRRPAAPGPQRPEGTGRAASSNEMTAAPTSLRPRSARRAPAGHAVTSIGRRIGELLGPQASCAALDRGTAPTGRPDRVARPRTLSSPRRGRTTPPTSWGAQPAASQPGRAGCAPPPGPRGQGFPPARRPSRRRARWPPRAETVPPAVRHGDVRGWACT